MSGTNPFRRKTTEQNSHLPIGPVHNAFENDDTPEPRIPPIDTDLPRLTKTKTGKTVRIISPHSATSDGEDGMPHRFFSPPPILPSSPPSDLLSPQSIEDDSPEDPFNAESDGTGGSTKDEGTRQNTLSNSGNLRLITGGVSAMPTNPFKKTLASLSTESRPGPPSPGSEGRSMGAEPKTTRPHYDVDDFKKLLLTGEKSVSGANAAVAPPVSFQSPAHVGDSSSNTDASSISRQSIFEPVSGPLQDSPRTSHESVPSDDERQRLVGSIPTASERIKPSTPKRRHGKLVKPTAPQTVSFEDPSLSFSDSVMSAIAPVDRSMPGTPGDVDKPLPPLPPPPNTQPLMQSPIQTTDTDVRASYFESEDAPSSNTAQKRSPPAPPHSRRHSQLRAKPFASSSERSTPITEETLMESTLLSQSPPTAISKAPPPPPPRRAGLVRGNSSSSMSTGAFFTPMSDQSNRTDVNTPSAKPRPPVPPNRSPSVSSVKRPNQTQFIPGSPSMAPPPPPRRRGSSQSSYTPSRLSGQRLRSDSGASSISHLAMTPVGPSGAENKDVMADLSALQREVDELRGKFKD
ncbi:hypothetical protein HO173_000922 [Letharia columbiana]|uniref:Uncharacterized protein n=1 Tax=Letharia columbiana TaxID=112416 RepID=A0A8H6L9U0_9LECA|nr:uncharacterized protein HO173_000922 [Letharia columbiana]KAF6241128.1 hypothetical protein HO173_000922 [Letharia columbiana]